MNGVQCTRWSWGRDCAAHCSFASSSRLAGDYLGPVFFPDLITGLPEGVRTSDQVRSGDSRGDVGQEMAAADSAAVTLGQVLTPQHLSMTSRATGPETAQPGQRGRFARPAYLKGDRD